MESLKSNSSLPEYFGTSEDNFYPLGKLVALSWVSRPFEGLLQG